MAAPTSRTRAFFLELVLDIVIFSICAAVALQVFVQARVASDQSSALSHLTMEAQQMAETFKFTGTDPLAVRTFDATFQLCDESVAQYRITCTVDRSQHSLSVAHISAIAHNQSNNTSSELFNIDVSHFNGREAGGS